MVRTKPVVSSNLVRCTHIGSGVPGRPGTLVVEFKGGRKYGYAHVPLRIYRGLVRAPSPGRYFAEFVREQYLYERVG